MKITWFGTASILLETQKTSLLFDPYLKDLPENYEPQELRKAREQAFKAHTTVLITHGHFDHIASIPEIYKDIPCNIYLTKTPYNTLVSKKFPKENLKQISASDTLDFDDVKVTAIQGKHIDFIKKDLAKGFIKPKPWLDVTRGLRLTFDYFKYPQNDEILLYEIEAEGKLIQLMGSADLKEGVSYRKGADLLILPHQGRKDIDQHNARIVDRLCPKRIVLDHYDNSFPPYSIDVPVDEFCAEISKKIPTEKLVETQTITL